MEMAASLRVGVQLETQEKGEEEARRRREQIKRIKKKLPALLPTPMIYSPYIYKSRIFKSSKSSKCGSLTKDTFLLFFFFNCFVLSSSKIRIEQKKIRHTTEKTNTNLGQFPFIEFILLQGMIEFSNGN